MKSKLRIAIVGSGPAGLMAATFLSGDPKFEVHLFEKRAGLGRKLLIAGSSGLNISHDLDLQGFCDHYQGWNLSFWQKLFTHFGLQEWLSFIQNDLGLETFLGTSDRYFVREMKASGLLKKWTDLLVQKGTQIHASRELENFTREQNGEIKLGFKNQSPASFHSVVFALGGGSWETETPAWTDLFSRKEITMLPFAPSNVGFEVAWSPAFLKEAEGKPLKKIRFTSDRGSKGGELVITSYGLEGTPVYFFGKKGTCFLDLKPDLSLAQIHERLSDVRENLAPLRRAKAKLGLCEASLALLFHHAPPECRHDLQRFAEVVKRFPVELEGPRPLSEAISSTGGVPLDEVTSSLELKRYPGIFLCGEMLNWDAPTGGFLIQASVSMGAAVAKSIICQSSAGHSPRRI